MRSQARDGSGWPNSRAALPYETRAMSAGGRLPRLRATARWVSGQVDSARGYPASSRTCSMPTASRTELSALSSRVPKKKLRRNTSLGFRPPSQAGSPATGWSSA